MKRVMVRVGLFSLFLATVCGLSLGRRAASAEPSLDENAFVNAAKRYEISTDSEPDTPFELIPKPLLSWSNPERRTPAGAVFLYTLRGRPQVALCVYPNLATLDHEFQSLASEPLLAKRDATLVWTPRSPGIEFKTIASSPPPGATPLLRLREMRNLSRQFSAEIVKENLASVPLRLLPTPIYRYPPTDLEKGIVDGAVFAFVQGTDPEVLLLIEAHEDTGGKRQWYYGLARMSMVRLSVHLENEEVWRTQWAVQNPSTPYFTIGGN